MRIAYIQDVYTRIEYDSENMALRKSTNIRDPRPLLEISILGAIIFIFLALFCLPRVLKYQAK